MIGRCRQVKSKSLNLKKKFQSSYKQITKENDMTAFIAKLVTKPEKSKKFEELQMELRELTHEKEPDAYIYELLQSQDDSNTYFCIASFKDKQAFDHHMSIDFHDRIVPPLLDCLAQDMELTMCSAIGPEKSKIKNN